VKTKKMCLIVSLICILGFATAAHAEWEFGIGTGLAAMKTDGDMGFNVDLAGIGPVTVDASLSPSDIMDYMDTALGLGVFATDGKWMIQGAFGKLKLADEPKTTVGANTIAADFSFDVTTGELTVGYPFYSGDGIILRGYTGFRYIRHELDNKVVVNSVTRIDRNIDNNWTDGLIGLSADLPFAENWSWNTKFDAGFGGSEGSYYVNSGIAWKFSTHWSTTLFAQYYAIEYENGNKGDADWYLYDVDESTLGLKIAYVF
jgi:hypothetical protein